MASILVTTAAPRLVNAVTAAAAIRLPATAYSTIVRPSSSRRNALIESNMSVLPIPAFRRMLAVDRRPDGIDLGYNGRPQVGECRHGGSRNEAPCNRILHHRQAFFVAQKRD